MTKAEWRTGTGAGTFAGKVEYRYCLSCGSSLSDRIEYNASSVVVSWKRYEYDGLNLLRVDERYDTGGGSIGEGDPWRTLEVATHRPGVVGILLGKQVYTHTNNDYTPDVTKNYLYAHDAVGNVYVVFLDDNSEGAEQFYFVQDAFGNELSVGSFSGSSWATARASGVTEHQTGKWIDPFTGLYFVHARWYDPVVGRWTTRSALPAFIERPYEYVYDDPVNAVDNNGVFGWYPGFGTPDGSHEWFRPQPIPRYPGPNNAYNKYCTGQFGYYKGFYTNQTEFSIWIELYAIEYIIEPADRAYQGCDWWSDTRGKLPIPIITAGRAGGGRINPEDINEGLVGFLQGRDCKCRGSK